MYDFYEPWDADDYLQYMYDKYTKETKNPLPMNQWLKQYEAKDVNDDASKELVRNYDRG